MPNNTISDNLVRLNNAKTSIADAITAKGGTVNEGDGLEDFATDIASITNQYTVADEGKVVSNGSLVAQTAYPTTITENGTYNTTENNSVTVNVQSVASAYKLTPAPISSSYGNMMGDALYSINGGSFTSVFGSFTFKTSGVTPTNITLPFMFNSAFTPSSTSVKLQGYKVSVSTVSVSTTTDNYQYNVTLNGVKTNTAYTVYIHSLFV